MLVNALVALKTREKRMKLRGSLVLAEQGEAEIG
jgi:hypothetical protein